MLRIGWAGREGEEAASQLDSLLGASKLAEVELLELEYLSAPSDPVGLVEVALATPAQFKVVDWDGNPAIVASPDPGRLFKAAADALSDGDVVASNAARLLLAVFTAQVGGQWFPATVYLDDSRPTNWAVAGWARVAATRGAPLLVPRLLNMLHAATLYVGVGKSRFEGFGLAGVPLAGNPSLVKVPCIPWPLKAAHALQPRQARGPARRGGRRPGRTGPP